MKPKFLFSKMMLAVLLLFSFSTIYGQTPEKSKPMSSIPAELNTIFTTSCLKCHGTGGGSYVLSRVDFSKWDEYTADVKAKKAKAITDAVANGSMPPKSYVNANPKAALLKDQIDLIHKWSDTFTVKK
jgi:mono/diheme cytochrome c family protein